MEKQTFKKAGEIESRIGTLKLIKAYLTSLMINEPLKINLTATILGTELQYPIHEMGLSLAAEKISKTGGPDCQYLVDMVDKRIIELEKEFNQL